MLSEGPERTVCAARRAIWKEKPVPVPRRIRGGNLCRVGQFFLFFFFNWHVMGRKFRLEKGGEGRR